MIGFMSRWFRRRTPLVTQSELVGLLKKDRSEIARELRIVDTMRSRPHRAVFSSSYTMVSDWKGFISWIDEAIHYLEQTRSTSELEELVRDWQNRRKDIDSRTLRWNRRSDVIPIGTD
jgi:hypothetical protein